MVRSVSRRHEANKRTDYQATDEAGSPGSYERAVSRLWRHYENYLDARCSEFGISGSHVPLLMYLWAGNDGTTQSQIAAALGVDKGTVSRNVRALVGAGLITQSPCERDSRACSIELTDEGRKMAEPITTLADQWRSRVTEGMTPKQRQRVFGHLHEMADRAAQLSGKGAFQV